MRGECIIVSVLVLTFRLCYANVTHSVPIHSSQLDSLNDEVKVKVYEEAYYNLKSILAELKAKNKACNDKAEEISELCERTNCEKSNFWKDALQKVKEFGKKTEKTLKKIVGYERLKKAWKKVEKYAKKLKKPLKTIGKAARTLVRKLGRGVSRAVRRAVRSVRRAIRRVTDQIRRVVRVRVRVRRVRFRRFGKKRSIAERSTCALCKRLADAKDNEPLLISLVCGSNFQQEESVLIKQAEELERLMSSLENENNKVKFVIKILYDPRSIFYPNGQLSFSKVYVTLSAKSHIWTFQSPNPLILVPFKPSKLVTPITKGILQKYGVN